MRLFGFSKCRKKLTSNFFKILTKIKINIDHNASSDPISTLTPRPEIDLVMQNVRYEQQLAIKNDLINFFKF